MLPALAWCLPLQRAPLAGASPREFSEDGGTIVSTDMKQRFTLLVWNLAGNPYGRPGVCHRSEPWVRPNLRRRRRAVPHSFPLPWNSTSFRRRFPRSPSPLLYNWSPVSRSRAQSIVRLQAPQSIEARSTAASRGPTATGLAPPSMIAEGRGNVSTRKRWDARLCPRQQTFTTGAALGNPSNLAEAGSLGRPH